MSRPFVPRNQHPSASFVRVNGKIRAREVRLIGGEDGKQQLGVMTLSEALGLARTQAVDLVEIAPNANPPVCRLVDFGKFRYEQSKKDKESKKHQHANRVKEIQLSPNIDPHDFGVKLTHAIDFLCEEMKVKVSLRFRGREMAHQEFGFKKVHDFIKEVAPYGHPDAPPKLIGKGINLMLSPLPRAKRAKNPKGESGEYAEAEESHDDEDSEEETEEGGEEQPTPKPAPVNKKGGGKVPTNAAENENFGNTPFSGVDLKVGN